MFFFFFNDTATTEIYTLSLHDALPICVIHRVKPEALLVRKVYIHTDGILALIERVQFRSKPVAVAADKASEVGNRSEEHTSELQSLTNLVCRLLLEKKQK